MRKAPTRLSRAPEQPQILLANPSEGFAGARAGLDVVGAEPCSVPHPCCGRASPRGGRAFRSPVRRSSAHGASWHGARIAQRRAQSLAPAATKRGHGGGANAGTARRRATRPCWPRLAKTPPPSTSGESPAFRNGVFHPQIQPLIRQHPLHLAGTPAGSGAGAAQLGAAPIAPLSEPPRPLGSDPPPGTPSCRPRAPTWERSGAGRAARSHTRCSAQLVIVTFGISRFHSAQ